MTSVASVCSSLDQFHCGFLVSSLADMPMLPRGGVMPPIGPWSSVAGGLIMPPEFADQFGFEPPPIVPRSSVHVGLIVPSEFAQDLDPELSVDSFVGLADHGPSCLLCRGNHAARLSCPCRRCGFRHVGDCATICGLCQHRHVVTSRCRLSVVPSLTASRRALALFTNDDAASDRSPALRHHLGVMIVECDHCRARFFPKEKVNCCHGGDVVVPWDIDVPVALSSIILSAHVRQNIRPYNTVLAFASTGHQNKSLIGGNSCWAAALIIESVLCCQV